MFPLVFVHLSCTGPLTDLPLTGGKCTATGEAGDADGQSDLADGSRERDPIRCRGRGVELSWSHHRCSAEGEGCARVLRSSPPRSTAGSPDCSPDGRRWLLGSQIPTSLTTERAELGLTSSHQLSVCLLDLLLPGEGEGVLSGQTVYVETETEYTPATGSQ